MNVKEKYSKKIEEAFSALEIPGEPSNLYDIIRYTIDSGGKRLRPLITLMGCDLFNGNISKAIHAAVAMEIFHNFTLLHDDIMDDSPMRRRKPSVYKKWGVNSAILSGDTMFVHAYEQLCKTQPRYWVNVLNVFNQTARQVCEGQQYDMDFETHEEISIADYIRMIRLKTAVLIAGSLKIGAIIGGASIEDQDKLYRYGESLGIAFQLQDDYLDAFGDENIMGKQQGNDIVTNKKTFLYLKALEIAGENTRNTLQETYQSNNDRENKIMTVKKIYRQLNIDEIAKTEMNNYFHMANSNLEEINVNEEQKNELRDFAKKLKNRNQ